MNIITTGLDPVALGAAVAAGEFRLQHTHYTTDVADRRITSRLTTDPLLTALNGSAIVLGIGYTNSPGWSLLSDIVPNLTNPPLLVAQINPEEVLHHWEDAQRWDTVNMIKLLLVAYSEQWNLRPTIYIHQLNPLPNIDPDHLYTSTRDWTAWVLRRIEATVAGVLPDIDVIPTPEKAILLPTR